MIHLSLGLFCQFIDWYFQRYMNITCDRPFKRILLLGNFVLKTQQKASERMLFATKSTLRMGEIPCGDEILRVAEPTVSWRRTGGFNFICVSRFYPSLLGFHRAMRDSIDNKMDFWWHFIFVRKAGYSMFSLFKKKRKGPAFLIDTPALPVVPDI